MWSNLRRWLLPPKPTVDDAFRERMHNARAFGIEQQRASLRASREMRRVRDKRSCQGPVEDAAFPVQRREGRS